MSQADGVVGQVLRVDRFGNLISNIDRDMVDRLSAPALEVRAGARQGLALVTTYADVAPGEVCALFGSTGHLEIAANGASASTLLDLECGALVHVGRRA
jgi:S-adenosylmethionine hydrolase